MAKIYVDGRPYEVHDGDNLLHACLSKKLDLPYFCWHPAMGSVGACRQCAVKQFKDENDTHGKIVMSCMTPAADGTRISIDDPEARAFRAGVIEWLMINHPHDCPVCEEGGHCHLQDMTVMTGHARRRYRFTKRTHLNQELGPFIAHEMNRCIACYRCVRFYRDYADGQDLGVFGAHDNVYFGRECDGVLENEFSGNLTEVCPTGVFTDKTHSRRYTRKWDMQFAPSICAHCSLGCNVSPGERYGEIRRVENRYNSHVNHYFLCDRGRFGYGFVNRGDRPRRARLRLERELAEVDTEHALAHLGGLLRGARRVLGIGSPRASVESNFALRTLVGADNFFDGHAPPETELVKLAREILSTTTAELATLRGLETADAALVLGEDLTQTAPRAALALRQAAKGVGGKLAAALKVPEWQAESVKDLRQQSLYPVFLTAIDATRLDDVARHHLRAAPEQQAAFAMAVAQAIDPAAPPPPALDADTRGVAAEAAAALLAAERPLIVAGTSLGSAALLNATANLTTALSARGRKPLLFLALPEANSLGLSLFSAPPLTDALQLAADGQADVLLVLENDLYRRASPALVDAALTKTRLVVIDHQLTATAKRAEVLLPAATVFEGDGIFVNNESRAQRHYQVFQPDFYRSEVQIAEAWRWLDRICHAWRGDCCGWEFLDQVTAACAKALPQFARITEAAPSARFRIKGLKLARAPARYSGRTAMRANLSVHEPRAPQDPDSPLAFSMEGYAAPDEPGPLVPFAWAPGWDSPQAWNKFQDEVGGKLRGGDPGLRLIDARPQSGYRAVDCAAPAADGLRVVALHHIFGDEELSALAAPVSARTPAPYLALATADARRLGLAAGDIVDLAVDGTRLRLTLKLSPQLAPGCIGVPLALLGLPVLQTVVAGDIRKVAAA
ncbi:MAG: NADH-quinone oxidoreductase subunit NuoG [Gammaproteobacteria bacterium]|nr:NADH-quinone oxidoreductase subunit NuoG [Gammaproteobacteria bacterium]